MSHFARIFAIAALVICLLPSGEARADRIKDLVTIGGIRSNQLVGYGLVVGLDGSGDQTNQAPFTSQSLKTMLARLGVSLPPGTAPQTKNVAAVALHATLPPFAKPGQTLDVTVSSIGNATSLRGGSLLMSPLKGADDQVYAVAQGNVFVPGISVEGAGGSSVTVNIPSGGRIPNGAIVEREVSTRFGTDSTLKLNLHNSDFTTAQRITAAISTIMGPGLAWAIDATTVEVRMPLRQEQRVAFVSTLENIVVDPANGPAKVVVNSKTGTVIITRDVRVTTSAVSHHNITVTVRSSTAVSQPPPLSTGSTVTTTEDSIVVDRENLPMFAFDVGVSLDEIVKAVNAIGASNDDLVSILEALKAAGALRAELVFI